MGGGAGSGGDGREVWGREARGLQPKGRRPERRERESEVEGDGGSRGGSLSAGHLAGHGRARSAGGPQPRDGGEARGGGGAMWNTVDIGFDDDENEWHGYNAQVFGHGPSRSLPPSREGGGYEWEQRGAGRMDGRAGRSGRVPGSSGRLLLERSVRPLLP